MKKAEVTYCPMCKCKHPRGLHVRVPQKLFKNSNVEVSTGLHRKCPERGRMGSNSSSFKMHIECVSHK